MATRAASTRLGKEAKIMINDPPAYCYARPREDNILEWHFILRGPPQTPYHGGEYWGQLLFPPEYPFKPPGIKMTTPSGRFHENTKICTSMSDFHPGSWNPAWSVATILVGLLSFMCSDEITTGGFMASQADRAALARLSHGFNIKQPRFKKMFPDYCSEAMKDLPNMGEASPGGPSGAKSASATASSAAPATSSTSNAPNGNMSADAMKEVKQPTPMSRTSNSNMKAPTQQRPDVAQARVPGARYIVSIVVALCAYYFVSSMT